MCIRDRHDSNLHSWYQKPESYHWTMAQFQQTLQKTRSEAASRFARSNYSLFDEARAIMNRRARSVRIHLALSLIHIYPRLIMGHGLGYGKRGAEKDDPGFDVTCYMARGGVFGTTVNRGDSPMIPTNGYGDLQASMFLAAGICAAIVGRATTGEGDYVTCALQHLSLIHI